MKMYLQENVIILAVFVFYPIKIHKPWSPPCYEAFLLGAVALVAFSLGGINRRNRKEFQIVLIHTFPHEIPHLELTKLLLA